MTRTRTASLGITWFLFFTGASALVYQVLWSRYLGLLLGSSAIATVVVLTTFMGGLAAGNWVFGRVADRRISRLTLYAWLEMAIGVYCLLFPSLLAMLTGPYLRLVAPLHSRHLAAFTAARFVFAAVLLLPPTLLMGGTLPTASRFLLGLEPGVRRAVARLYWVNSAGAALGALLAGFWLIPTFGLDLSMTLAATVNVGVAIAAIGLRNRVGEDPAAESAEDSGEAPLSARAALSAVAAVTLSGFSALVLEVAWTRLLALVLGGSTYAFTIMLATFILGIALGSLIVARPWFAHRDPVSLLAVLLVAVAGSLATAMPFYERLPYTFQLLGALLQRTPRAYPLYQLGTFVVCLGVMIVPTTFMGATLPVASRIAARGGASLGRYIGLTYAANTAGTLLGAAVAGLVFLPLLGLQRTMQLAASLYGIAALLALVGAGSGARRRSAMIATAAAAAVVAVAILPPWRPPLLASGAYRLRGLDVIGFGDWARSRLQSLHSLFNQDGPTATVTVFEERGIQRSLRVNGKTDASNGRDMATQILLGQVPMLLGRPDASRAAVIGLGAGVTVGAIATHPGVQVEILEIEPAVIEAARDHFRVENRAALDSPDVTVHAEDAKTFFQLSGERYDVVVSEPSNPWIAGIAGLFTEEYFRQVRSRLARDGVMGQWFHGYESSDEMVRLIVRTFRKVFRYVTIWELQATDYLLVGSDRPLVPDFAALERRMAIPAVKESLAAVGIQGPAGLLVLQTLSPEGVDAAVGDGPVNTDQFPLLEFVAPEEFFIGRSSGLLSRLDERLRPLGRRLFLSRYLERRPLDGGLVAEMARALDGKSELAQVMLQAARRMSPQDAKLRLTTALALWQDGRHAESVALLERTPADRASLGAAELRLLLAGAMETCRGTRTAFFRGDCADAVGLAERVAQLPGMPPERRARDLAALASALLMSHESDRAFRTYEMALAADGSPPLVGRRAEWLAGQAEARLMMGDLPQAHALAEAALHLDPAQASARRVREASAGTSLGAGTD